MDKILNDLGVEKKTIELTAERNKEKTFTTFTDMANPEKNQNHQADLLELLTFNKFTYVLIIVDIASREFDAEPIRNKTAPTVLKAIKNIYSRNILSKPGGSFATDKGTEFKGVVDNYLKQNNIYHKIAETNRHSQQSIVERVNKDITKVLYAYINQKEKDTGKAFRNWVSIVPRVVTAINKHRKKTINVKNH